jgi:hypothetical protein
MAIPAHEKDLKTIAFNMDGTRLLAMAEADLDDCNLVRVGTRLAACPPLRQHDWT